MPTMQRELTWEETHRQKRWGTCPEPMMARFVKRRIKEGGEVLDIGCGIGANAFWLASEGYRVRAVDIAPAALERLRQRHDIHFDLQRAVNARVGDLTKGLDILSETLDGVVDVCCVQHIMDPMSSLQELRRVLKPDGWFFSMTASHRHAPEAMSGHAARFSTENNVRRLYQAAGFAVRALETAEHSDRGMTIAHYCLECTRA